MILGHGIDIVNIARLQGTLDKHKERFLKRCFTENEQQYALAARNSTERLAGRFAAKEAALKALGTGWRDGIAWTDIQITALASGQPELSVSGMVAQIAQDKGIERWLVSISHTRELATASVLALGAGTDP